MALIAPPYRLENSLTSFGIIDQRVPLTSMNKLKMLSSRLTEDGFLARRHFCVLISDEGMEWE